MKFLSWLWSRPGRREITALQSAIVENDKAIEATKPMVDEAVRRTDDGLYRLRAKVGVATRRVAYEGALIRDLTDGWGRGHG